MTIKATAKLVGEIRPGDLQNLWKCVSEANYERFETSMFKNPKLYGDRMVVTFESDDQLRTMVSNFDRAFDRMPLFDKPASWIGKDGVNSIKKRAVSYELEWS